MKITCEIIPPNNTPEKNKQLYDETIRLLKRINKRVNTDLQREAARKAQM